MSGQAPESFKPLLPVYGAYPIPAVLKPVEASRPTGLLHSSEDVVEQIAQASTDRPVAGMPRMENHVPLVTPDGVVIERSSYEQKTKRDPEVSREIIDTITFSDLGGESAVFDQARLFVNKTELRGSKGSDREMLTDAWRIQFYKPGEDEPAAEIRNAGAIVSDSYIEVDNVWYSFEIDETSGGDTVKSTKSLAEDHPEILNQLAATMQEMQLAILQPMQPALSDRDIAVRRSANFHSPDPHIRQIGLLARIGDRIMKRRNR